MQTNSNLLDLVARAGALLTIMSSVLIAVGLVGLPGATPAAPTDPQPVAVVASDTAQQDAAAEGADVLPVSFHDAPWQLWNGLIDQYPGAYDDDVPGIGTFWLPVGSAVDFRDSDGSGLFLATIDGIMVCIDGEDDGLCSVVSPMRPTSIRTRTATEVYEYQTHGSTAQCGSDAQCAALHQDRALAALGAMTAGAVQDAPRVVNVAHSEPLPTHYPRRSPNGARVLPQSRWLDNSPVYRDGYVWLVDDTAHTTSWRKMAEDGSLVPPSFYDHAPITGASQAICDALHKRRVPHERYGHVCV